MNDFRTHRIGKGPAPSERVEPPRRPEPEKLQPTPAPKGLSEHILHFLSHHYVWTSVLVLILIAIGKTTWNVITMAEDFSVKEIVLSAFSERVAMDDESHTNILLLGTGTKNHDGSNLTDTIMIATLDHKSDTVALLSIPRDLYITIPEIYGGSRINSILELVAEQEIYNNQLTEEAAYTKGYEVLMRAVGELFNTTMHYYARIDFKGFEEGVDALGGIDLEVATDLYDPFYPASDGSINYQTFSLAAGPQHLDGATALKYVRSRKTTSDFDRAERQQHVLSAIQKRALSLGILGSPSKLHDLYETFQSNFHSNLKWDELAYLAKFATDLKNNSIQSWVLNDNPLTTGGLLYTPERELYQGAYVLVPYRSDNSDLKRFADLVLHSGEALQTPLTYQLLNGTKANGVATETLYYMNRFGFEVTRYGNAAVVPLEKTRFIPRAALLAGQKPEDAANQPELKLLREKFLPVGEIATEVPPEYAPAVWETQADVIIELGQDYVDWMKANRKYFY